MLKIQPSEPAQSNNHQVITDHSHTAIRGYTDHTLVCSMIWFLS